MSRWCLGLFASAVSSLGGFRGRWCLGFFASAVSRWCLHRLGMCSVTPKIVLKDSKGDVKEFFGVRFGRFSARVEMMFGSFCICSAYMVFAQAGHVPCGSKDCAPWLF